MNEKPPLKGISTINFTASDLEKEETWYSEFLGIAPYFKTKGYIEFRIGEYQQELELMGAKIHHPIVDRSNGFYTASLIDPFGNILGIMTNPHF
jgi:catechol-2,3-dioxygenase